MLNIEKQFGDIYDQYIEKIYRFVYLKVDSQETAEDITSKVFLKGWESFKNAKNIQNIGAFLYQIARNSVTDYYREKGRIKMISADVLTNTPQTGTGLHEKALANVEFEQIKLAIKELKQDYQDVIIWHYVEGMPIAEIAQTMEKPEGTIRVMLHRGLKELRSVIKS